MTGDELKEIRERMGMDRRQFGRHVANLVGARKPYPYSRVFDYETGVLPVPSKIEVAFLRHEISCLREDLTAAKKALADARADLAALRGAT